jgi:hypothetical protein
VSDDPLDEVETPPFCGEVERLGEGRFEGIGRIVP